MHNISLQEQELIRNIADLIIQNPLRAQAMFGNFEQIIQLYPDIRDICLLVNSGEYYNEHYQYKLIDEINRIKNPAIRNIFYSAIYSYRSDNYY
jgi:hypothetical protein